ncbi:MAG: class I mannose-6-phosphate isomerase [Desulfarculaceae bacterium]|nr:class I mannose-6-phosphate isomerase [Desulfarculaceae bacterium]MCF8074390.1 class I mannose-6-phosphate isomerase [Desulfarculaceae bacterium]MCF8103634.1 class I mannose-6-phosphate isomerase [Desulfarculaceae bacterium]MCF8116047.1 class I mannose-6-phosphate isomerase [Desulfarculaceae bacterium]
MIAPFGALRLEPVFLDKVWAPSRFPALWQKRLSPPPHTGEAWLASDRHHVTPVAEGPLAGQGLDQLVSRWPEYLLGPGASGGFPLLLKLLNVDQWLSVQVHPDDAMAARLEKDEPWGKSEAWHILAARPGAKLVHGLKRGLKRADVERALAKGGLADLVAYVPARQGDTFAVSGGVLHSAGPGLFFLEVQQASDVTYRLYDWDRAQDRANPRPLHHAKGMKALRLTWPGRPLAPRARGGGELLVQTRSLGLLKYEFSGLEPLARPGKGPGLLLVGRGAGRLSFPGGEHPDQDLAPGQCWLLPAGLAPARLKANRPMEIYQAWAPAA